MAFLCRDTSTRPDFVDDRRPRRSKLNGLRSLGAVAAIRRRKALAHSRDRKVSAYSPDHKAAAGRRDVWASWRLVQSPHGMVR